MRLSCLTSALIVVLVSAPCAQGQEAEHKLTDCSLLPCTLATTFALVAMTAQNTLDSECQPALEEIFVALSDEALEAAVEKWFPRKKRIGIVVRELLKFYSKNDLVKPATEHICNRSWPALCQKTCVKTPPGNAVAPPDSGQRLPRLDPDSDSDREFKPDPHPESPQPDPELPRLDPVPHPSPPDDFSAPDGAQDVEETEANNAAEPASDQGLPGHTWFAVALGGLVNDDIQQLSAFSLGFSLGFELGLSSAGTVGVGAVLHGNMQLARSDEMRRSSDEPLRYFADAVGTLSVGIPLRERLSLLLRGGGGGTFIAYRGRGSLAPAFRTDVLLSLGDDLQGRRPYAIGLEYFQVLRAPHVASVGFVFALTFT